jgi:hypothetical protein
MDSSPYSIYSTAKRRVGPTVFRSLLLDKHWPSTLKIGLAQRTAVSLGRPDANRCSLVWSIVLL